MAKPKSKASKQSSSKTLGSSPSPPDWCADVSETGCEPEPAHHRDLLGFNPSPDEVKLLKKWLRIHRQNKSLSNTQHLINVNVAERARLLAEQQYVQTQIRYIEQS